MGPLCLWQCLWVDLYLCLDPIRKSQISGDEDKNTNKVPNECFSFDILILYTSVEKDTDLVETLNLLEACNLQTSTLSLLDNSEDPDKPLLPEMKTQRQKTNCPNSLKNHVDQNTEFTLEELGLRVRNCGNIGKSAPEEMFDLSKGDVNFQTSVIKGASSAHPVGSNGNTTMLFGPSRHSRFKCRLQVWHKRSFL